MPLLFRLLSRLPLPFLHLLGALAGRLVWMLAPTYRRVLRGNLRQALGDAQTPALERRVSAEAGKALFELPIMWCAPPETVVGLVREVRGWEVVDEARARGAGLVFLTPHLGCWEITAQYIANDALVLPVDAQAARFAPTIWACVNAAVMPLSLKLPEGFIPSYCK